MTNAAFLHGETIGYIRRTETGTDPYGRPTYRETSDTVDNVLIGQPDANDRSETLDLTGYEAVYTLGIPTDDDHDWRAGDIVEFWGTRFRIIGAPVYGERDLMPFSEWKGKVQVAKYE